MTELNDHLLDVLRATALDDIMATTVRSIEEIRSMTGVITERDADLALEAIALHRLSIGLDRLHQHVARARDVKLAKLRDDQKWPLGKISKRTTIERTLVQKLIRKGRVSR